MTARAGNFIGAQTVGYGEPTHMLRGLAGAKFPSEAGPIVDVTPPNFAGVSAAVAVSQTSIRVEWLVGSDDYTLPEDLVYLIHCARTAEAPFEIRAESLPGELLHTIGDLQPGTSYRVRVLCRDAAGNVSTDDLTELQVSTNPDLAPTFGGVTAAVVVGEEWIQVSWNAAADDISPRDAIRYHIHYANEAGATFEAKCVVAAADVLPPGWELLDPPILCSFVVTGLIPGRPYWFKVRAEDAAGHMETNTVELGRQLPARTSGAPSVMMPTPAPGATIQPNDLISFQITDIISDPFASAGFRRILVTAHFPKTGLVEVIHNGDGFTGFYSAGSSRTPITNGYQYSIRRSGGWPDGPQFTIYAIDNEGNESGDPVAL